MPELLTRLQVALANRYRIEGEIGAGGMATVYLAQAKTVALKALEMDDTLAEAHTSLAYGRWLGDLDW